MLSDFSLGFVEHVFDSLGDIVYCVKDREGVYRSVNLAFVARVNGTDKSDLLGKTASQVFSKTLAEGYEQQDRVVFQTGRPIQDQLERITNSDGSIGWYLASKFPIHDQDDRVVGLVGISQDLNWPNDSNPELAELKAVVEYIKDNLDQVTEDGAFGSTGFLVDSAIRSSNETSVSIVYQKVHYEVPSRKGFSAAGLNQNICVRHRTGVWIY